MIKILHRPWYDISFCTAHNESKHLFQHAKKSTTGHRHAIFTNSILPTRCCATMVQKFMHKIPGRCKCFRWTNWLTTEVPIHYIPPNFSRGITWRTPCSLLSLHGSFHTIINIGQNLLPNNLSIMKSKHMTLDMFHLKLAYTYVHTYIRQMKKVLKLGLSLLR